MCFGFLIMLRLWDIVTLGMNYTLITEDLIVGSQPQKVEDINHLKEVENVAYILNLQQDSDVAYWGVDLQSIIERCKEIGIRHMRRPVSLSGFVHLYFAFQQ